MAVIDLSKYGIKDVKEVVYNPSYEVLFEEETKAGLEGYEVGKVTELGAVNVMTGVYTGRSPKDKFIFMDENSNIDDEKIKIVSMIGTLSPKRKELTKEIIKEFQNK